MYLCFVRPLQQTAIISPSIFPLLFSLSEAYCVLCMIQSDSVYIMWNDYSLQRVKVSFKVRFKIFLLCRQSYSISHKDIFNKGSRCQTICACFTMNQFFLRWATFEKSTNAPKFHAEFGLYCTTAYKNKCKEVITFFQVATDPCVVFLP